MLKCECANAGGTGGGGGVLDVWVFASNVEEPEFSSRVPPFFLPFFLSRCCLLFLSCRSCRSFLSCAKAFHVGRLASATSGSRLYNLLVT